MPAGERDCQRAQRKVEAVSRWSRAELALLFKLLCDLGWTRQSAEAELRKAQW